MEIILIEIFPIATAAQRHVLAISINVKAMVKERGKEIGSDANKKEKETGKNGNRNKFSKANHLLFHFVPFQAC